MPVTDVVDSTGLGCIQGAPIKTAQSKNFCLSTMAVRILAKLSDFMCEYLHHISYTDFIKTAYTKDTKVVVQ